MNIVMISIFLNLAVGIMITKLPAFSGMDDKIGVGDGTPDVNIDNEVQDTFGESINADPNMEDPNTVNSNTIIDKATLGGLEQIKNFINKFMFGFVQILQTIFSSVPKIVFSAMRTIISILYAFAIFELISGRRLDY